jgi:hypothetical protein
MNFLAALTLLFATGLSVTGCNPRGSSRDNAGIGITPFAPGEGYGLEGSPCATCLHAHCEEPLARLRARSDERQAVDDCFGRCNIDADNPKNDEMYRACILAPAGTLRVRLRSSSAARTWS